MEGEMIDRWIEKLMPMFNGEHTLAELTEGLPAPHRNKVYEIANVLNHKGMVRDVSLDRPHQLRDEIIHKYAGQIAFLDSFGDSGAYRFQSYRQASSSVLAVGSGPFFVSLVSAMIESGLTELNVLILDSMPTNKQRLAELAEHARKTDQEVTLKEIKLAKDGTFGWREVVQPYNHILYVSQEGNVEELHHLQAVCKAEKKVLLPALCLHQTGMAGPLVHHEAAGGWESAWRRIHRSAVYKDPKRHTYSSTAGALLANVIVFELFKVVTGATESELRNSCYLLDLETLEGSWHPFLPHPQENGWLDASWVQDLEHKLGASKDERISNRLFSYLSQLTSKETGILHCWEEGDLRQLPLSQCRVQAIDPLSKGPAELLPDMICAGMTHEEARREAGLAGMEAYVSRFAGVFVDSQLMAGIGVGESVAEGVVRGLHSHLANGLRERQTGKTPNAVQLRLSQVEDDRCRYYLQSLTVMRGTPVVCLGEEVSGFPVVWVGTGDRWFGSVGLNVTIAMRKALQAALLKLQNSFDFRSNQVVEIPEIVVSKKSPIDLQIPACDESSQLEILRNARQILQKNGKHLTVLDLAVEPFLREVPEGVFGVLLREGEAR
jgi:putative thiazole-containing bacteriocin maturation protein